VNGHHDSSVSRAYYAAFQAAIVALEAAGIENRDEVWSHAGLQDTFARELIHRRKLYPADFARYLHDLLERRIRSDYRAEDMPAPTAARCLSKARARVTKVKEVTAR
jgi:uncharacterized protein (UPF0332 family)